ncbi:MAG TPA: fibronectin type III domain-containing protein [Polyangia bacterium]|nr:fibronectin type III domain-containing protein [Polyangia bacterium]
MGPDRPPDFNGWYNHAVTFGFPWADGLSGLAGGCQTGVTYNGASGAGLHVSSTCSDVAGNANGAQGPAFNFDGGGPTGVAGAPARPADHNGWFNHAVAVAFTGTDPTSGISSCTSTTYAGPDNAAAAIAGGCTNGAGLTAAGAPVVLRYDDGAPAVTGATADRPPDSNGWYNHPVAFAFHGSDSASGIAGCSSASYSGPDDGTASLRGSCTDNAGNSASRTISFRFDEHAPDQSKLFAIPANKSIDLSWSPPSDAASYTITRKPAVGATAPTLVYQGSGTHFVDTGLDNGKKYNYVLTTFDAAGNGRITGKSAVPDGSSLRPFIDSEVGKPPRLSWGKVRRARYYNLQLFKGRKKILSTWPKRASLRLKSSWRYNGKKIKLRPGLYRWYVWPGYGSMKRHKYGNLVGSSTFRLVK